MKIAATVATVVVLLLFAAVLGIGRDKQTVEGVAAAVKPDGLQAVDVGYGASLQLPTSPWASAQPRQSGSRALSVSGGSSIEVLVHTGIEPGQGRANLLSKRRLKVLGQRVKQLRTKSLSIDDLPAVRLSGSFSHGVRNFSFISDHIFVGGREFVIENRWEQNADSSVARKVHREAVRTFSVLPDWRKLRTEDGLSHAATKENLTANDEALTTTAKLTAVPELPEVETVVRQLRGVVEGQRIRSVAISDPKLAFKTSAKAITEALADSTITSLQRRGKYIVFVTDGPIAVSHLRMTGAWLFNPARQDKHVRAVITFTDNQVLAFSDVRRFGTLQLFADLSQANAYLDTKLGPEPLEESFDSEVLRKAFAKRSAPAKGVLLDQTAVAGIGNIYADEALFIAGIHPSTPANLVSKAKFDPLVAAIKKVLLAGIDAGGSTIGDFQNVEGVAGSYQWNFLVHRREGKQCPNCQSTIVKTRVAGRGTYNCPKCQRRVSQKLPK